ncbi:MAG: glycosyltransferase [Candidatus Altiarchaeota archaeon]
MRVAFVVSEFPVVSQSFIIDQIVGVIEEGCDVRIFSTGNSGKHYVNGKVDRYSLIEKTEYLEMPDGMLERVLKAVLMSGFMSLMNPLIPFHLALCCLRDKSTKPVYLFHKSCGRGFDVIHAHFGFNGSLSLCLKKMGVKGKIVTAFHGYDISMLVRQGIVDYGDLFREGDLFLPVSEHFKDRLVELGCDEGRIIVHPMGVDLDKFRYRGVVYEPGGRLRLITVGRLTDKKGYKYSIRAVGKLVSEGRDVEYTIVGDGDGRRVLESLVSELCLEGRVRFEGKASHDEVAGMMNEADVFVLASHMSKLGDEEGIPSAIKEASAIGLPVVATLHGGIPEIIEDGVNGLLVPERDADAIAERIAYLMDNPGIWEGMCIKAREVVEEKYDIRKLSERLVRIYESIKLS